MGSQTPSILLETGWIGRRSVVEVWLLLTNAAIAADGRFLAAGAKPVGPIGLAEVSGDELVSALVSIQLNPCRDPRPAVSV